MWLVWDVAGAKVSDHVISAAGTCDETILTFELDPRFSRVG
jgi:hypothetical protein